MAQVVLIILGPIWCQLLLLIDWFSGLCDTDESNLTWIGCNDCLFFYQFIRVSQSHNKCCLRSLYKKQSIHRSHQSPTSLTTQQQQLTLDTISLCRPALASYSWMVWFNIWRFFFKFDVVPYCCVTKQKQKKWILLNPNMTQGGGEWGWVDWSGPSLAMQKHLLSTTAKTVFRHQSDTNLFILSFIRQSKSAKSDF